MDLSGTIRKILRELQNLIEAKEMTIEVTKMNENADDKDAFIVQAEELLCHSMFANLIKNAIEAAPESSRISVSFERGDTPRVCIHNSGAVPENIRDRFFEKYATSEKEGGTGLGTYSARVIAETMGGRIALDTSDENGTAITVHFALNPA